MPNRDDINQQSRRNRVLEQHEILEDYSDEALVPAEQQVDWHTPQTTPTTPTADIPTEQFVLGALALRQ